MAIHTGESCVLSSSKQQVGGSSPSGHANKSIAYVFLGNPLGYVGLNYVPAFLGHGSTGRDVPQYFESSWHRLNPVSHVMCWIDFPQI